MSSPSTPLEHTVTAQRSALERQAAVLGEMAEAGLRIVLALRDQAVATADHPAPRIAEDIGLAYDRVSRAVRLTLVLQAKVLQDIKLLDWSEPRDAEKAKDARRNRVQRIVERVITAAHDDRETMARLARESGDRLDNEDLFGDVLRRPMSELVAEICKTLGLSPDWTRLALEAWAQEEIQSGEVGAPLAERAGAAETPAAAPGSPGPTHPAGAVHAASP